MTRTWDDNRAAINQLWPVMQFTEEEKKLWCDDLSSLDQDTLYDAIRNVKRNKDSLYPQLKWVLDAFRELDHAKRQAIKQKRPPQTEDLPPPIVINEAESARYAKDFVAVIDAAQPRDFDEVQCRVLDHLPHLTSLAAMRLLGYARQRLLGESPQFGRLTEDGDVVPFFSAEPPGSPL